MALNRICVFYGQRCDRPSLRCYNSQNGRFLTQIVVSSFRTTRRKKIISVTSAAALYRNFGGENTKSIVAMANTLCSKSSSKRYAPLEA